jgi:hypothetical protein
MSSSQGLYLNTEQHKQNKHIHIANIHALSGIRTHDPGFQASDENTCLRPLDVTGNDAVLAAEFLHEMKELH